MRKYLIHLTLIGSFALSQNYIAVIDFSGNGISSNNVNTLTDRFRIELFRTGKFIVAEREMMNQVLDEQGFQQSGCSTNECLVEMGKLIGVSNIIGGSVSKFGNLYSVSLRMVDIELGTIVQTAIYDHDGKFEDLLIKVMKKSAEQFAFAIDPDVQTSETTPSDKSNLEEIVDDQPTLKERISKKKISSFNFNQMGITVSGGLNFSNVKWGDSDVQDFMDPALRTGLALGCEKMFGPLLLGVGFVQRGSKSKVDMGEFGSFEANIKFNYLSLYGLYPYSIMDGASVFGGLQFGYFLNGTIEADRESEKIEGKDIALDYGLLLGIDYFFTGTMGVRASYYFGIASIDKDLDADESAKHNGIGISFLYKL